MTKSSRAPFDEYISEISKGLVRDIGGEHNVIKSKEEYTYYCKQDKLALGIKARFPSIFGDEIWKFEIVLRKLEYLYNCKPFMYKVRVLWNRFRKHRLAMKCCGFQIPCNVFGPGLAIVHYGSVVVSSGAKVGKNCRIHEGVTIGATNHERKAAQIGDNCFIGTGAKIIGDISIGDNVSVGAGAVVVNSFDGDITIAGVPARIISNNTSRLNMNIELLNNSV